MTTVLHQGLSNRDALHIAIIEQVIVDVKYAAPIERDREELTLTRYQTRSQKFNQ